MANKPFTIRIFVPDGDPEGVRMIDRMNWNGLGIVFPRDKWLVTKQRAEFTRPGVYILSGYVNEDDELPTLYVGEGDVVGYRIDAHFQKKVFWDRAIVFTASNNGLHKAHVQWLEYALVKRATEAKRSLLDNGTAPTPPALSEAEVADVQAFLDEILQILPLVGLRAFELPKAIAVPAALNDTMSLDPGVIGQPDTIVVPAQQEGFQKVFIGESCWYAIRIAGGMLSKIKYIAAYRTQPESRVTHYASVASIEPYGEESKYKVIFAAPAKPLQNPIPFADAPKGSMQAPRYTTLDKLMKASKLSELF